MAARVLDRHVLVLNKSWAAIGTTTVMEAVILMIRGSAEGLCTTTFLTYTWDEWVDYAEELPEIKYKIKTPGMEIPAPEVIRLSKYNDIHRTVVKYSNLGVYRRDNFTCQYCNKRRKKDKLSIDHVIPKSKGGKSSWTNCVTACFDCNNRKGDKTLEESNMKLQKQPYRPKWSPVIHIREALRPDSWKPLLKD